MVMEQMMAEAEEIVTGLASAVTGG
jgi:hypothetical protein